MATIPDINALGARPSPKPNQDTARFQNPYTHMEHVPGSEMESIGRENAQQGQRFINLGREIQEEQLKVDAMRAEDAFNQLRNSQLNLAIGDDGFTKLHGVNALQGEILKNYGGKFDLEQQRIADSLQNDQQKQLFSKRAMVSKTQFTHEMLSHVAKETDTAKDNTFKGTVAVEQEAAAVNWPNPAAILTSLSRIDAAVNTRAQDLGLDDNSKAALLLHASSGVHTSVVKQALANGNLKYAEAWYEQHKDQIDPNVAAGLAKAVEDGAQKQLFNGYQSQFLAARDSSKALSSLEKAVLKDDTLNEDRKNILIGRIQSRGEVLANRAERQQAQFERQLERQISAVNSLTLQGYEPTAEQMVPLVAASKGTAAEPMVRQMIATANATRQFRNQDFRSQEQTITQMEAAARQDPTKFDVTAVAKFKAIHEAQQKAVREDPTTFAVRQGMVDPRDPAAAPLNLAQPDPNQLAARFDLSRSISSKYAAPMKPLTEAEVNTLTGALREAKPAQKQTIFSALAKASGNDAAGYKAVMSQVAPDDPVTALAGVYATGEPRKQLVSNYLLEGQAILKPNRKTDGSPDKGSLWPMPSGNDEKEMKKAFATQVGDAYAGMPKTQSDLYQAAVAYYAGKAMKQGKADGVLDTDIWKEAVNAVTGGVASYKGKHVVLPWGMAPGDFKDQMKSRIDVLGGLSEGVTPSKVRDMPVQAIGDGKYVFRAGDGILVDKNNRPVVVDLNAPVYGPSEASGKIKQVDYGLRNDGTKKGSGWLGELKRPDGGVSTELSIGVNFDGKEREIPALVPALTKEEIKHLLGGGEPTKAIIDKAVDHARGRINDGKSPFKD
jgi:hypothetical protein